MAPNKATTGPPHVPGPLLRRGRSGGCSMMLRLRAVLNLAMAFMVTGVVIDLVAINYNRVVAPQRAPKHLQRNGR